VNLYCKYCFFKANSEKWCSEPRLHGFLHRLWGAESVNFKVKYTVAKRSKAFCLVMLIAAGEASALSGISVLCVGADTLPSKPA
jgi:hypothetical protein